METSIIASHVQRCFDGFEKACISFSKADLAIKRKLHPYNLNDELGRFRLWCGNVAAHRRGKSSLDHKLREASHIRDRVIELLKSLETVVQEANEIMSGERVPWEDLSDSDSDTSSVDISNGEDPDTDTTELRQLASNMAETITCLMRLSMAIRNPAPHDQFKESAHIDTSHFELFDIEHVRGKFTHVEEYLAVRLGKALSRRRQYLRYRDEHQKKLKRGLERTETISVPAVEISTQAPVTISAPSERIESTIASSIPLAIKESSTTPDLDENDFYEDTLSQTSYASSTNDPARLRPPPLPDQGQDGDPFECPLCFRLTSVQQTSAWHKHVYRDLQPYVCTFKHCQIPDVTYESRHDWFNHEMQHRTSWLCLEGCNISFQSRSEFREHFQDVHLDWPNKDRLEDLIRTCEKQTSMDEKADCPLCYQSVASLTQLRRHLGKHHEELSLFVLPSSMKDDDDDDDDDNANDARDSRTFASSVSVGEHSNEDAEKYIRCEFCSEEFTGDDRESRVERHLQIYHTSHSVEGSVDRLRKLFRNDPQITEILGKVDLKLMVTMIDPLRLSRAALLTLRTKLPGSIVAIQPDPKSQDRPRTGSFEAFFQDINIWQDTFLMADILAFFLLSVLKNLRTEMEPGAAFEVYLTNALIQLRHFICWVIEINQELSGQLFDLRYMPALLITVQRIDDLLPSLDMKQIQDEPSIPPPGAAAADRESGKHTQAIQHGERRNQSGPSSSQTAMDQERETSAGGHTEQGFDEEGEKKVTATGELLGGRKYRVATFAIQGRGEHLFMLADDCALELGFSGGFILVQKNPTLHKAFCNPAQIRDLIDDDILPQMQNIRPVLVVSARSIFRHFGHAIIQEGQSVRDDYWVAKAQQQHDIEEEVQTPGSAVAQAQDQEKPSPSPQTRHVDVPSLPQEEITASRTEQSSIDPADASQEYFIPPYQYGRPPRLPLPIEEEIYTPGSPIISPADLSNPAVIGAVDGVLPRRSSVLSSTTADDDDDDEPTDYQGPLNVPTVPTVIEWEGPGERVYVTGTFAKWDRKYKLHQNGPSEKKDVLSATVNIPPGVHHLKFIVDNEMRTSDNMPTAVDFTSVLVNYLEVSPDDLPQPATSTVPSTVPLSHSSLNLEDNNINRQSEPDMEDTQIELSKNDSKIISGSASGVPHRLENCVHRFVEFDHSSNTVEWDQLKCSGCGDISNKLVCGCLDCGRGFCSDCKDKEMSQNSSMAQVDLSEENIRMNTDAMAKNARKAAGELLRNPIDSPKEKEEARTTAGSNAFDQRPPQPSRSHRLDEVGVVNMKNVWIKRGETRQHGSLWFLETESGFAFRSRSMLEWTVDYKDIESCALVDRNHVEIVARPGSENLAFRNDTPDSAGKIVIGAADEEDVREITVEMQGRISSVQAIANPEQQQPSDFRNLRNLFELTPAQYNTLDGDLETTEKNTTSTIVEKPEDIVLPTSIATTRDQSSSETEATEPDHQLPVTLLILEGMLLRNGDLSLLLDKAVLRCVTPSSGISFYEIPFAELKVIKLGNGLKTISVHGIIRSTDRNEIIPLTDCDFDIEARSSADAEWIYEWIDHHWSLLNRARDQALQIQQELLATEPQATESPAMESPGQPPTTGTHDDSDDSLYADPMPPKDTSGPSTAKIPLVTEHRLSGESPSTTRFLHPSSSHSEESDNTSRVNKADSNSYGDIRQHVGARAPLTLQFNDDMDGRSIQINTVEGDMADIVISNARGDINRYRSERGSISGRKKTASERRGPRREAEEESVSRRSSRSGRVRDEERLLLKRKGPTQYYQ